MFRVIFHLDMDAFYASVEQRDDAFVLRGYCCAYSTNNFIDDIRIYNRALSSNEVQQLFALESAPIISIQKAVWLRWTSF